jgi:L-serine dehydratase
MMAARRFRELLAQRAVSIRPHARLKVELYGSLSKTGRGHYTDGAICAGLVGEHPAHSPVDAIWSAQDRIESEGGFDVDGVRAAFRPSRDFVWKSWRMDHAVLPHPNTMRFVAEFDHGETLSMPARSVGGGFVDYDGADEAASERPELPYPFDTAGELIVAATASRLALGELLMANEMARGRTEAQVREGLSHVWSVMNDSIERGLRTEGVLPGGLDVPRRAPRLQRQLEKAVMKMRLPDLRVSAYAFAVNEENAAGGRIVTAPTNGSAGVVPAVLRELIDEEKPNMERIHSGLLVAGAVGAIVKRASSISGAEVGCQGEVGTSSAMAAAMAVDMLGGSARQAETAAEIAIEHHLGMTCDPVQGLVQIPCIERNGMGAVKALAAAAMALASEGVHLVSLDHALKVMKQTGLDMKAKYRETATGGLGIG